MFSIFVFLTYVLYNFGTAELVLPPKHYCKRENNVTVICNFIPESIPIGILNVHLILEQINDTTLTNSTFISSGWDTIKLLELEAIRINQTRMLIFQDDCFNGLRGLQALRLHMMSKPQLSSKSFCGLDNLVTLDLSGSLRLKPHEFVQALDGSDKVPRLTKLLLSNCSLYTDPFAVDENFVEALKSKNISFLDVSGLQFTKVNLTSFFKKMKHLEVINASYITIGEITFENLEQENTKHIKIVDTSYITLPKKSFPVTPGKYIISNISVRYSDISDYENIKSIFSPEAVNFSGIVPKFTSVWMENCTLKVDKKPSILTKEIICRKNNLRRLDLKIICEKYHFPTIERIDASENELEFFPDIASCIPNVEKIDLSKNQLIKMARESILLFEYMFSRLKFLKNINLSSNELITIPFKMFESNRELEIIDLSSNSLNQVHFNLIGLTKLRVLNLQGNYILTLDTASVDNLNDVTARNVRGFTVILKSNPLSCSKCETKHFLMWLLSTNLVNISAQKLTCFNENGLAEDINENTIKHVAKICERRTIIITANVSAGVIVLILIFVFSIVYKQRKHAKKVQNRANVIHLLRKGEDNYEFAVFLAYSSEDEDFVNIYILNLLNENLQLMTGIERELVCTGDRHFRPGFYVHNEAYMHLDSASVMVVVASNNFCQSSYCRNELDQAYVKRKPIILMFIEHIDQNVMTPTMKELYQRNVRVLWTVENGEYKMKTTWENVCTSILDLIQ